MFTSKELNAFIYTAEERSITQAANRLFLTPPSVCSMVKKLEKRINKPLFCQVDGAMTLTQEGRRLFTSLKPLFYALKDIEGQQREQEKNHLFIYLHSDFEFMSGKLTCHYLKKGINTTLINHDRQEADILIGHQQERNNRGYASKIEFNFYTACARSLPSPRQVILSEKTKNACWFPKLSSEIRQQYGEHEELIENSFDIATDMLQHGLGMICIPELSPQYPLITQQNQLKTSKLKTKACAFIHFNKNINPRHRSDFDEFIKTIKATSQEENAPLGKAKCSE